MRRPSGLLPLRATGYGEAIRKGNAFRRRGRPGAPGASRLNGEIGGGVDVRVVRNLRTLNDGPGTSREARPFESPHDGRNGTDERPTRRILGRGQGMGRRCVVFFA